MASVNISGGLWSSLILDQQNCQGDQEGFLIGEVTRHVTSQITDSHEKHKKEEIAINVFSYFPCPELGSFYNRKGHVNQVQLLSMLKENYKHVVGWYKFRRMTSLEVSMREQSVHQSLLRIFRDVSEKTFLFGLFTSFANITISTHSTDYLCLTYNGSEFTPLPVTIFNLGNTEHSEYRTKQNSALSARNGSYNNVLDSFRDKFMDDVGQLHSVKVILQMNTLMQSKLVSLQGNVSASEDKLEKLSSEVSELRRKAETKRKTKEAEKVNQAEPADVARSPGQDEPILISSPETHNQDMAPVAMETNAITTETDDEPTNDVSPRDEEEEEEVMVVVAPEPAKSSDPFAGMINEMVDSIKKSRGNARMKRFISEEPQPSRSMNRGMQNEANGHNVAEKGIKDKGREPKYEQFVDDNGTDSDSTFISSQNSNTDYGVSNSPVF